MVFLYHKWPSVGKFLFVMIAALTINYLQLISHFRIEKLWYLNFITYSTFIIWNMSRGQTFPHLLSDYSVVWFTEEVLLNIWVFPLINYFFKVMSWFSRIFQCLPIMFYFICLLFSIMNIFKSIVIFLFDLKLSHTWSVGIFSI